MDSARPTDASDYPGGASLLLRSLAKLVRLRRGKSEPVAKPSEILDSCSDFSQADGLPDDEKKSRRQREAMEALLARVFAGVSSVKASYAQLQVAQSPYDPGAIQSADRAIVSELRCLSQLKHVHLTDAYTGSPFCSVDSAAISQLQEQRSLLETFKVTAAKLEAELRSRDAQLRSLKRELQEATRPGPGCLRLADLNATHFLQALQAAMRAVRAFVRALEGTMENARWDLAAAASVAVPGVHPCHRSLAFEALVCRAVFDGFHLRDFRLPCASPDAGRDGCLREFLEARAAALEELLDAGAESLFGCFVKTRFSSVLPPAMEDALFGGGAAGAGLSADPRRRSSLFLCFAETARRVWALHRLFWAFEAAEVFVAAEGERFSEVFMVSAAEEDDGEAAPAVAFAVSPGFRVGGMVVQCRVYLKRRNDRRL